VKREAWIIMAGIVLFLLAGIHESLT